MSMEELELENAEHISENLDAKKVANYGYDLPNSQWRRMAVDPSGSLVNSSATQNIKITESGNYTYIAKAPVGTAQATAGWQAFRIDENTSNQTLILYADGNSNFDNVATDLTSLTYS